VNEQTKRTAKIKRSNEVTPTAQTAKPVQVSSEGTETWVHEALEPDQLSRAKPRFGRRAFSGGTLVILWALRVYVIVMVLLIGLQIWNAIHGGS
jgi:hypothetical protein